MSNSRAKGLKHRLKVIRVIECRNNFLSLVVPSIILYLFGTESTEYLSFVKSDGTSWGILSQECGRWGKGGKVGGSQHLVPVFSCSGISIKDRDGNGISRLR